MIPIPLRIHPIRVPHHPRIIHARLRRPLIRAPPPKLQEDGNAVACDIRQSGTVCKHVADDSTQHLPRSLRVQLPRNLELRGEFRHAGEFDIAHYAHLAVQVRSRGISVPPQNVGNTLPGLRLGVQRGGRPSCTVYPHSSRAFPAEAHPRRGRL